MLTSARMVERALDLMLLVATLDNRSEIEELRDTVQKPDRRLDKLVA
jgi:predicted amino acid-binding ACT domain protein